MNSAWITAAATLALVVGALATFCGRWAWRILSRTMKFLDDYFGEPARDGVPARPGVMARLGAVETALAKVLAETQPNHGHSLRDVVHQIREDLSDVKADQAAMRARMEQFEHQRHERDDHPSSPEEISRD